MTTETIAEYQGWFVDTAIAKWMERPTEGWALYLATRLRPSAWAAFEKLEFIGYIEVAFFEDRCAVALAIKPQRRGKGIGSGVLAEFLETILSDQQTIAAFIDQDNIAALRNAEKVGFARVSGPDENGLISFELKREIATSRPAGRGDLKNLKI